MKATKKERKNRNVDLKAGNTANALNESMEIKKDKKALTKHVKGLKKEGAKHPIKLAGKQIRRTK